MTFGQKLREKRLSRGFSLRKFAAMIGVSPTYLSQIENNVLDPPTADRARRIADLLAENADEWIAMAGHIPDGLAPIIQANPVLISSLIRALSGLSDDQLKELQTRATRMTKASLCHVCGKYVTSCICPECPICGVAGNPDCYFRHAMVRTRDQIKSASEVLGRITDRMNEP